MNRFTEKVYTNLPNKYIVLGDMDEFCQALNKFGQLEDIEEELGIDLITFFKALKNGCYGIQNGKVYKMKIVRIDSDELNSIILFRNASYGGECYLIKDYGKTWALTKEELKK